MRNLMGIVLEGPEGKQLGSGFQLWGRGKVLEVWVD
jgi:hypothetical protein